MTATVAFIFEGQPSLALPRMLDLMRSHLKTEGAVTDASLTALTFEAADLRLTLTLSLAGDAPTVTLSMEAESGDTPLPRLAALAYAFVRDTDVAAVIWHGTDTRIPRAQFLSGLARSFDPEAARQSARPTGRIAPRRIAVRDASAAPVPQFRTLRFTGHRYDAHVAAFETHLAAELRRTPTASEMQQLEAEYEPVKNRMSALTTGATAAMQSAELRAASLVICVTSLVVTSGASNLI